MSTVKAKDVLGYVTLPRVVPRFKWLLSSSFAYLALLMAHIYAMVKLLHAGHPYLQPENMGRFSVLNVVSEASRNLTFSYKNMDQLIIFFALLAGIVMLLAQFLVVIYAVFISPAMAFSWFETTNPTDDIAYNLLDQVFGIPGIYCDFAGTTCTAYSADPNFDAAPGPDLPLPFHIALHGLFQFYSTALLLIAVLIFLYFVVVILVETVTSGTPFGQRFQNVWAPIRLVVALGLLMPVPVAFTNLGSGAAANVTGLNSGQYIVLYVAKYASSFATNGWNSFNTTMNAHAMFGDGVADDAQLTGERYSFLVIPEAPSLAPLVEAMSIVHTCAFAYHALHAAEANRTRDNGSDYPALDANYTDPASEGQFMIAPYWVKMPTTSMSNATLVSGVSGSPNIVGDNNSYEWIESYAAGDGTNVGYTWGHHRALGFYYGSDIIIRFGERRVTGDNNNQPVYKEDVGEVKSLCGDIRIPVTDLSDPGGAFATRGGADHMLRFYYTAVLQMWFNDADFRKFARASVASSVETFGDRITYLCTNTEPSGPELIVNTNADYGLPVSAAVCQDDGEVLPEVDWRVRMISDYSNPAASPQKDAIIWAWEHYIMNGLRIRMETSITDLGWGGAGIWYNKIAEINGGWMDSVQGVPTIESYPLIMEMVRDFKKQHVEKLDSVQQFNPTVKATSNEDTMTRVVTSRGPTETVLVAEPLSDVYSYWHAGHENPDEQDKVGFENAFKVAMNMLVGLGGLQSMRGANMHVHPLAQLVAVGKGLVNSAVTNIAAASGSAFMGGLAKALGKAGGIPALLEAFSQILYSVAFMGITAGFVLFYVLPFMPFLYFFFAVASWVKAIFEAMVGVPLWALAHLRIDGEGLPGDAAQNGYFLLLEIFVRPILTVVGLVAAISIFSTQVRVLNLIWDLVAANASGYDPSTADILSIHGQGEQEFGYRRGVVDGFFFMIIYAVVCYMMAMASFKLIDKIPDNILRWAGAGVSSFGDIEQDNLESLNRYAAMGGMTIGNQAAGAVVDASRGTSGALGSLVQGGGGRAAGSGAPAGASVRPN